MLLSHQSLHLYRKMKLVIMFGVCWWVKGVSMYIPWGLCLYLQVLGNLGHCVGPWSSLLQVYYLGTMRDVHSPGHLLHATSLDHGSEETRPHKLQCLRLCELHQPPGSRVSILVIQVFLFGPALGPSGQEFLLECRHSLAAWVSQDLSPHISCSPAQQRCFRGL